MILNELYDKTPEAYQNPADDNSQPQMGELRKSRLTLAQIHKLRLMNDQRQVESEAKLKYIKMQYAPPPEPAM